MHRRDSFPIVNLYSSLGKNLTVDSGYYNFFGVLHSNGEIDPSSSNSYLEKRLIRFDEADESIIIMGDIYKKDENELIMPRNNKLKFYRPFRKFEYLDGGIEGLHLPNNFWDISSKNDLVSRYAKEEFKKGNFGQAYKCALYAIARTPVNQ